MTWIPSAIPLPVTYNKPQETMKQRILGVVLHTTNHAKGDETLERFRKDWQGLQWQSAHFMVDRSGTVGQFRSVTDVAWHIGKMSVEYIGIEHIAKHRQSLTAEQIAASGKLIAELSKLLQFPIQTLTAKGNAGVGIHEQFHNTGCGQGVFWSMTREELDAAVIGAMKPADKKQAMTGKSLHLNQFSSIILQASLQEFA
jgi:N-acetyl-anhydromuramyl-L-alanine amidase AmpD